MRGRSSENRIVTSMPKRCGHRIEHLGQLGAVEREAVQLELDALEEHAVGGVGVLLGVHDVAAVAPHEVGHGRDHPRLVGAGQQEHGGRSHGAQRYRRDAGTPRRTS